MIDLKLDKLPGKPDGDSEDSPEIVSGQPRKGQPRRGLSISETIAGDASLSVGSTGVDTSGVAAGAGAGAGLTNTTPGAPGSSPAPTIVPGARGSGTTARASVAVAQEPTLKIEAGDTVPGDDRIAARAYECWHERGCPHGSPEVDWHRAESELRSPRRTETDAGEESSRTFAATP